MSNQSPCVPKFGDWDVHEDSGGQQSYTLIFNNMRADKSLKNINPNDPAFLAEYFNSPSSASSQAVVHDADSAPPAQSAHESPPYALNPTSRLSLNQKNQSPCVPKFGDWDVDGENGGEQAFTLIFDNMRTDKNMKRVNPNDPAVLADLINSSSSSSSSSQAVMHGLNRRPPSLLRHKSPQPPIKPTSRGSMNHKAVMAPKFGDWDVEHPAQYTAVFDGLKQEKRVGHASTHHGPQTSTSPTTPLPTHKTRLMAVMAPKFGDWDVEHPAQYTAVFDGLKQEKRVGHASTHHGPQTSTSPTTPLPTHKTRLMSWRLCFSSSEAVRD